MGTSVVAGKRDLQYFQRQKLLCLREYLQERGIHTSSKGKGKRKAELVDLAFSAHSMKLPKVSDGESENEKLIMADLLSTDEVVLPEPASILNCSGNLSLFPEVTLPHICTDEYSSENLKSFKSLRGSRLFKD